MLTPAEREKLQGFIGRKVLAEKIASLTINTETADFRRSIADEAGAELHDYLDSITERAP